MVHVKLNSNLVKWPCSPWVFVAQWIARPPCVRKFMVSIPLGDSDFFSLSYAGVTLISSLFTFPNITTLPPSIFSEFIGAYNFSHFTPGNVFNETPIPMNILVDWFCCVGHGHCTLTFSINWKPIQSRIAPFVACKSRNQRIPLKFMSWFVYKYPRSEVHIDLAQLQQARWPHG